jgi:hypothetical protein
MSCGCAPSVANNLSPVVYDPITKQIRPLAFGEKLPEGMCMNCERQNAMAIPAKQIQDAYFGLYNRLKKLEEKYCNCLCPEDCPECPECPECPPVQKECTLTLDALGISGMGECDSDYDDCPECAADCDDMEGRGGSYYSRIDGLGGVYTPGHWEFSSAYFALAFKVTTPNHEQVKLPADYSISVSGASGDFESLPFDILYSRALNCYIITPIDVEFSQGGQFTVEISRTGIEEPCSSVLVNFQFA